jgi:hypothetical protein
MDVPIDPELRIFVLSCGAPIQRRMGDGDKTTKPFWATGKLMLPFLSSW